MNYEERIIDGVLHYRGHPDQYWVKRTDVELTAMLFEARKKLADDRFTTMWGNSRTEYKDNRE